MSEVEMPNSTKGFASMTAERRREISSKGGKSAKPENRTFFRDREIAAAAGKKGGKSVSPKHRPFSRDLDLASRAGKKGGAKLRIAKKADPPGA
jgi:general stress protein YciG